MRFGSPKPLLQNEFALFLELSLVDLAPGEPLFQNSMAREAVSRTSGSSPPRALRRPQHMSMIKSSIR